MDKRKLVLGALGIFLAGVLAGVCGFGLYIKINYPMLGKFDKLAPTAIFMERLDAALSLSAEQKAKIGPILEESYQQLREAKAPCLKAEDEIIAQADSRITALLEPGQVDRFRALMERFAAKRHWGKHPGPKK